MLGMLVGSFAIGFVSDKYGRYGYKDYLELTGV